MEPKERIREKAEELFMRYGIRSISMDEIAAQLGMSKKTLYQYYADKDELVMAVVMAKVGEQQSLCGVWEREADNPIHELFLVLEDMVNQFRNMNPSIVYDLERFHPRCYQMFERHKHEFLASIIRRNLLKGIETGIYRSDINVDILTRLRLLTVTSAFDPHLFPPAEYPLAEVAKQITLNFLYGLVTPEGYRLVQRYQEESSHETRK